MIYKGFIIRTKKLGYDGYVYMVWRQDGEVLTCVMDSGDFYGSAKEAKKEAKLFIDKELV